MRSRLLIIVLAAVLALAGTVAVFAYARHANERAIAGLQTETVFAAKGTIGPRTTLGQAEKAGLLTTEKLPTNSVPSEALQSIAGLGGLVFSASVQPAQLILRPMLVPATQSTAASVLPLGNGMEAVMVQMCASEVVEGYLSAGSEVAVYETYPTSDKVSMERTCTPDHNALPPGASKTVEVLPKVLILSALPAQVSTQTSSSGSVVADPINSAASALTTGTIAVTFEVSNADALQLIEAIQSYLPYLALLPATTTK